MDGSLRISNRKGSKFVTENNTVTGIHVITDEKLEMFDAEKELPFSERASIPRGIRNNNPGNIKDFGIPWVGLASDDEKTNDQLEEKVMCVFSEPEFGIRAMGVDLQTKQRKYRDCRNVRGIIERYAPKDADRNKTEEYIYFVSGKMKVDHKQTVSVKDYDTVYAMVSAMIEFENGIDNPYPVETMDKGLMMSGIAIGEEQHEVKSYRESRSMRNGAIIGTGSIAGAAIKGKEMLEKSSDTVSDSSRNVTETIMYNAQTITTYDWVVLGMLAIIAFAALDWVLDRRLTSLLGIK